MQSIPTLLLGSAGTGTAFAACCSIRMYWGSDVRVVGMDIHPRHLCTTSLLVDAYEQAVPFRHTDFADRLAHCISSHGIDTYLPLFPEEILIASCFLRDQPDALRYKNLVPGIHAAQLCADKLAMAHFLETKRIPVPRSAGADAPFESAEFFIKPRCGVGSGGAHLIQANGLNQMSPPDRAASLVQEVCTGPEVTIDAFVSADHSISHALCRERIEVKSGVCTKARIFADEQLHILACDLSKALGLQGSFCFQVMLNGEGRPVVTDVNPRPGAGTAMSVATGNDFFAATFAHAWGEDVSRFFTPLEKEVFVTRQLTQFVMTGAGNE